MRLYIKWYYIITTVVTLIVLCLVISDCIIYLATGEFSLLTSLNTLQFSSVDEAWKYIESIPFWGEGQFFQTYAVSFAFHFGVSNIFSSLIFYRLKILKEKKLILLILSVGLLIVILYFFYRFSIAGSVSEKYIRKMILM